MTDDPQPNATGRKPVIAAAGDAPVARGGPARRLADAARVRLCIVTRSEKPPAELIRFVAAPDGQIVADLANRLPGRGVYVTATRRAVAEAVKRGLFAKSLKQPVKTDKDLAGQVEKLLALEARQALSLANKAGLITTGFAKVETALERGAAAALLTASDAAPDGAGKLARKFRAIRGAAQLEAPILQDLTSAEMDLAMGGSNVIHAVVAKGGLGQRFIGCCQRLRHYRMNSDEVGAAGPGANSPVADTHGVEKSKSDQAGTDHA